MYRHLMVPLDDSLLSVESVRQAVDLARSLGAKVTFFHAQEDYGATSAGALERVMCPSLFNEHLAGRARAIVAKAESVARALGVPHDSVVVRSERAYEAILAAAAARGCDLIFMASHGRRGIKGLMLGSQTQKVLQHATIPVLVSAVESNLPHAQSREPLAIINDEHRSLAAVIHAFEFLVREARDGMPPPFSLLNAMLHYIREFPEKLHHPKEETYLFRFLRAATSEFDDTLDELARQHEANHGLVDELEASLRRWEADRQGGREAFAATLARFACAQIQHMTLEAKVIIPAALRHLGADDWAEMGAAFAGNADPRLAVDDDQEFRQLFARIINLTTTPA